MSMQRTENSEFNLTPGTRSKYMSLRKPGHVPLGLLLALVISAGCRAPANIPVLAERSVMSVELAIETEPQRARVFAENLGLMGESPVTHTWRLEKLTWSDGKEDFRTFPKGIRIEPGEELFVHLTVKAKGYKEKITTVSVPFSGREETVTRKITLEKR